MHIYNASSFSCFFYFTELNNILIIQQKLEKMAWCTACICTICNVDTKYLNVLRLTTTIYIL